LILSTVSDSVTDLLYYDRKEDESLPRGEIEEAIESGEISVEDIVNFFREELSKGVRS